MTILPVGGCTLLLEYAEPQPELCDNELDDDFDGATDCDDPDCDSPACLEADLDRCHDGRDNDADGTVDLADPLCWRFAVLSESRGCVEVAGVRTGDLTAQTDGWVATHPLENIAEPGLDPVLVGPVDRTWEATHARVLHGALDGTVIGMRVGVPESGHATLRLHTLPSEGEDYELELLMRRGFPGVSVRNPSSPTAEVFVTLPASTYFDVSLASIDGGWYVAVHAGGEEVIAAPAPDDTWESTALARRPGVGPAAPLQVSIGGYGARWGLLQVERPDYRPCRTPQPIASGGEWSRPSVARVGDVACIADPAAGSFLRSLDAGATFVAYEPPPGLGRIVTDFRLIAAGGGFRALAVSRDGVSPQGRVFSSADCARWTMESELVRLNTSGSDLNDIVGYQVEDGRDVVYGVLESDGSLVRAVLDDRAIAETQRWPPPPAGSSYAALGVGAGVLWASSSRERAQVVLSYADLTAAWSPVAIIGTPSRFPGTFDEERVLVPQLRAAAPEAREAARFEVVVVGNDSLGLRTLAVTAP